MRAMQGIRMKNPAHLEDGDVHDVDLIDYH